MRVYLFGISLIAVTACGPTAPHNDNDNNGGVDANPASRTCSGSETRCFGDAYEKCDGSNFQTQQICAARCSASLGCVACDPAAGNTCSGASVVSCNADGTLGDVVMTCDPDESCIASACSAGDDNCVDLAAYVYVIDKYTNAIFQFDPSSKTFFKAAELAGCGSIPAGDIGQELSPFSMSVGRNGHAYVLYQEIPAQWGVGIWEIDLGDGSCVGQSSYDAYGNADFNKFGMGFSTDGAGNTTDSLYVSSTNGYFGRLDLAANAVHSLGHIAGSPEMTGNAKGELWAYFAGQSQLNEIDKTSGALISTHVINGLPAAQSYAAAFWGGDFYLFVGIDQGDRRYSEVWKVDGADFSAARFMTISDVATAAGVSGGLRIVGAGVSTCAPIIVT